ncbi:hypothetical protein ACFQX6_45645 [Streptosporangium lutulentum]
MLRHLRPHSIQARFTLVAGILSLIVLMVIGVGLDLAIRTKIEDGLFQESLRAATYVTGWQAAAPRI